MAHRLCGVESQIIGGNNTPCCLKGTRYGLDDDGATTVLSCYDTEMQSLKHMNVLTASRTSAPKLPLTVAAGNDELY